jgi:general secretion pathway protein A
LLNNHAKGVNTVWLVDEAQQIHPPVLEFIRLLTNLETDKQKLLKIILVGQPELNDLLAQPSMA